VKDYVKRNNTTFKVDDVRELVARGVEELNGDKWTELINRGMAEEKMYWKLDENVDDLMEKPYLPVFCVTAYENTDSSSSSDIF